MWRLIYYSDSDDNNYSPEYPDSSGPDDTFVRPPFPPLEFPVPPYPDWLSTCQRVISWIQDKAATFRGLSPHDRHSSCLVRDIYSDHSRQVHEHTNSCDSIIDAGQDLEKKTSSPPGVSAALAMLIQVRIGLVEIMRHHD